MRNKAGAPLQHANAASARTAVLRSGGFEANDEWTPFDDLSLKEPLQPGEPGYNEDENREITITVGELRDMVTRARVAGVMAMARYIWFGCKHPWDALKRLLAITRSQMPKLLRGITQTEVSQMLDEGRAATQAREKRVVEKFLQAWGVKGFVTAGGKAVSTRKKYADKAKGNTNRKDGGKGRTAAPGEFPRRRDVTDADLENLAHEAERKRLGKLFGPGVEGCNARLIRPER